MGTRVNYQTIDEYIAAAAPAARPVLATIRTIVKRAVPDAEECVGYGMPALRRGRVFVYYAAFRNHIGVYPPVVGNAELRSELAPFRGPKGNLQFPLDRPVPYGLIGKTASTLAAERGARATRGKRPATRAATRQRASAKESK
jgi:uncharacterized protein YdhG (YjbR/CyaY superfamily)